MSTSVVESRKPAMTEAIRVSAPGLRLAFNLLLIAAAYLAGALIAKSLRFPSSHLSLLWPPTAIVMSALLLTPTRRWWMVLLAAAPAHVAVQLADGVPALGILSQLLGNFGQALLAAIGIRLFDADAIKLDSLRRIMIFAGAALIAPAVVSSLIANLYVLSGWEQDYWYAMQARFVSNVLSTLTVVPPIVLAATGGITRIGRAPLWRWLETVVLAASLVAIGFIAFGKWGATFSGHRLALLYAPLPLLLWASIRFGVGGLCLSLLVTAFMAFHALGEGEGPFSTNSASDNALSLQVFLIIVALPLLLLAGLVEERRQDHQSLRDSQRRFQLASAAGNVGLWDWSVGTGDLYVDRSLKALLGYREDEISNRFADWARRIHPDDLPRVRTHAQAHLRGETAGFEIEHRMLTRDGGVRWLLSRGSVVERTAGPTLRMVGTVTDITERKLAEIALQESETWYRSVVEDQTELICRFLPDGTYTFVNGAYCRYFQRTPEELLGRTFWQFIPQESHEAVRTHLNTVTPENPVVSMEHEVVAPNGEVRWQLWTDRGFFDEQGRITKFQSVGHDITKRRRAEQVLRQNEERLALAINAAQLGMWDWDLKADTTTWSDHMRRIYGREGVSKDASLDSFIEMIHPDDRERVRRTIVESIDRPMVYDIEYRVVRPDGTERWVLATGQTFFDANGRPARRVGLNRDITERKQAEGVVRETENQVRLFVEHTPGAVAMFDRNMKYLMYSRRWLVDYKLGDQNLVGRSHYEVFPEIPERWKEIHRRCMNGAVESCEEDEFIRRDGSIDWIRWQVHPWHNAQGDIGGVIMFTEVITERKRAEDEHRQFESQRQIERVLRASEERFRSLADNAPVLIWISGLRNEALYFNKPWLDFTGRALEQELGFGWAESIHPEDRHRCIETCDAAFARREPIAMQFRLRRRDGEYRWVLDNGIPHFGADGVFKGYIGSCVDITERQQAEDALEQASRRKDEFLAMLGHELRNPLAPIGMAIEIMRMQASADDSIIWARDVITRQVAQLTRLVDDLLDVSRITRGNIRLNISLLDLGNVISQAIETARPLIVARNHELSIDVANRPLPILGDGVRLAQMISNLLNNAAKYTGDGGRISLTVQVQEVGAEVVLKVADNGMGIPVDMLERVFDMFTQVNAPSNHSQGGLGIGLALVKRLVEMHGGAIEARSEGVGHGSEFVVRLPLAVDTPIEQPAQPTLDGHASVIEPAEQDSLPATEHKRILIVDDNVDAAESLSRMLRLYEHEVVVAHDGLEALAAARQMKPDIVLLDIGLPKMDGLEVAKRIRQRSDGSCPLLVATTGFGQAEDRRRTAAAGFDHHLTKPVDPQVLQSLVRTGKIQKSRS